MKKRMAGALSLIGLTGAYLGFRYPLLILHGMKEWPLILFLVGALVISISGLVLGQKVLPILTFLGYVLGFAAGYIFQRDSGVGLNNMWIIWSGVSLLAILVGGVVEIFRKKRDRG